MISKDYFILLFFMILKYSFLQSQSVYNIPDFVYSVRSGGCSSGPYENFQFPHMKAMGIYYIHGHECFSWQFIQPYETVWKWQWSDSIMDMVAANGMKFIPAITTPKLPYLHYDTTVYRDDSVYFYAFQTYFYNIVSRYKNHPAWSGMISVWGGSSDVMYDSASQYWLDPEREVPLLNAAYDGVKTGDSNTVVISFNMASPTVSRSQWEDWHNRAFMLIPKFDWFGVNTHMVKTSIYSPGSYYGGLMGLVRVRQYLDSIGYSSKPLFVREGGFIYGNDIGGYSPALHAEQTVTTYIISRALPINLKGWVYFAYFIPQHSNSDGDWGLLGACDQPDSLQPRYSWIALNTLFNIVKFPEFIIDSVISGTPDSSQPFIYKYKHKTNPDSILWTIFSPWWISIDTITGKPVENPPLNQNFLINISPFSSVANISMSGTIQILNADSNGYFSLTSNDSVVYLIGNQPSGTGLVNESYDKILIFPNPAIDYFTIQFPMGILSSRSVQCNIYDIYCNKLVSSHYLLLNSQYSPILPDGIYFLEIKTENQIWYSKLIIRH